MSCNVCGSTTICNNFSVEFYCEKHNPFTPTFYKSEDNEYKERQESSWQDFDPLRIEDLEDDKNYLIRWHDADGKYNVPHMAYWLKEENSFYFLHIDCSIPARVHQYMEIPE